MPKKTTSKLVISSDKMSGTSSRKFHATSEAKSWSVAGSKEPSDALAIRRSSKEARSTRGASRKRS